MNTAYGIAEINANIQTTAIIFEALRSPDIVYEYNGWHIAKYLFKEKKNIEYILNDFFLGKKCRLAHYGTF